jgi:PhoPQ-activated pathogenicity-related protein
MFYGSKALADNILDSYLNKKSIATCEVSGRRLHHGENLIDVTLNSLKWKGYEWTHRLKILYSSRPLKSDIAYLLISDSSSGSSALDELHRILMAAGIPTAVLLDIPNQPLFNDKREDHLIALSFHKFLQGKDNEWPLLLPMVAATKKAMECISNTLSPLSTIPIRRFILSGSSKRGWTTWLTATNDHRVVGAIPRVFDMINIPEQIKWTREKYGKDSENIQAYTNLGITNKLDDPRAKELIAGVDPYTFLSRRTLPIYNILGSNDPYWIIDGSKFYMDQVKNGTLLMVPQGGHSLSDNPLVRNGIPSWINLVVNGEKIPQIKYVREINLKDKEIPGKVYNKVCVTSENARFSEVSLFYSSAKTYDFRKAIFLGSNMQYKKKAYCAFIPLSCLESNCAYFVNGKLSGNGFTVSTIPRVVTTMN